MTTKLQVGQYQDFDLKVCCEYFVIKKEWMADTHEDEDGAVGIILCPKSYCKT